MYRELLDGSTCAIYALGLYKNPTYRAIATDFGGAVFAGRNFMEWAIRSHFVEIGHPVVGCLAMYFRGNTWRHVGLVSAPGRDETTGIPQPVTDSALPGLAVLNLAVTR